jgi:hypothetical protein
MKRIHRTNLCIFIDHFHIFIHVFAPLGGDALPGNHLNNLDILDFNTRLDSCHLIVVYNPLKTLWENLRIYILICCEKLLKCIGKIRRKVVQHMLCLLISVYKNPYEKIKR